MDFLFSYGLFLAKAITIVVAIIIVASVLVSLGSKNNGRARSGRIVVTKLNDRFEEMAGAIKSCTLEPKQLKKLEKADKKAKKQAAKGQQAGNTDHEQKKRVFVLDFDGDVKASATSDLREAITAVLAIAKPERDEVVLKLESQGGMVHSYGLAASQLDRLVRKNIRLTVCVDKVAASGGYMMACVAHKIIAAPFAIIGSIGVVAQLPNFHRLLQKHNVDYELLTAGEYKRTLTVFGENTDKGRQKFIEDLEDIHVLFKEFISEHRAVVNIEQVATGEIWFGRRALQVNLIDEIATSDEYLLNLHPEAQILAVHHEQKKPLHEKFSRATAQAIETAALRLLGTLNLRYWAK